MNAPQELKDLQKIELFLFLFSSFLLFVFVCFLRYHALASVCIYCVYIAYMCVEKNLRKVSRTLRTRCQQNNTSGSHCAAQAVGINVPKQVCSQIWCVCVYVQYSLSYGCKLHIHSRVTHIQTRAWTHEHINKHTHDHLHKCKRVRRHTYTHTRRHYLTQK